MRYVFGPVPSRRLGQSLGVDTIPLKTCNWNCIYCQLGRSMPMANARCDYFPRGEILREIKVTLERHDPGDIDWINFVGSGEPTLHSGLGWLVSQVKQATDIPVALCSNAASLYLVDVRRELLEVDLLMPTVAAGSHALHRQIHRPYPGLTFDRLLEGLIAFRREFAGRIWAEVMLLQGVNDTEEALRDIAVVLQLIGAEKAHIALPTRPPAETWVRPADAAGLLRALEILGSVAEIALPPRGEYDLSNGDEPLDAILDIVSRHPMRQDEVEETLKRWVPGQEEQLLAAMASSARAQIVERQGIRYWTAGPAHYPDERSSKAASPKRVQARKSPTA